MTDALVDLVVEDPEWLDTVPDLHQIATRAAQYALEAVTLAPDGVSLCLLACDDDRIATLNADFRGKPAPTNVLSWPGFDLSPGHPGGLPVLPPRGTPDMPTSLGDVAIALQTTRREANEASIPLKNHVLHLILHGTLHLLGFDHETDADAEVMEGIESRLLLGAGIADPYR